MKHEIHHIPARPAARIVAAIGGTLVLAGMLVASLLSIWLPGVAPLHKLPMAAAMFMVPLGWWLTLYVGTCLVCGMYNFCAPRFGGITLVLGEASAAPHTR